MRLTALSILLSLGATEAFHARPTNNKFRPLICTNRLQRHNNGSTRLTGTAIEDMDQNLLRPQAEPSPATPATTSSVSTSSQLENPTNYPPTPTFRECLAFALPALGIYICPPLMSLIDAGFIGRTSPMELAALGPASSISDCAGSS